MWYWIKYKCTSYNNSNELEKQHANYMWLWIYIELKISLTYNLDIEESKNIASLHKQIAACDTILEVKSLQF